jgi:hypothetical protein
MAGSAGASASGMGSGLRGQAAQARSARQAGERVVRGKSETALKKQAKAWDAGAAGEARAAYRLDALRRSGYTVLNDVLLEPGKAWNLDHLVVGPAGALFVDAKNWRGVVRPAAGGKLMRYWYGGPSTGRQSADMSGEVAKVRGMAARASERLGVRVRPIICLTGSKSRAFEGVATVGGVVIVSVDRVVPWLRDHEALMGPEQVKVVAAAAVRLFPPAVVEDPHSPEALRRAKWATGLRPGSGSAVSGPRAVAPAARPVGPLVGPPIGPAVGPPVIRPAGPSEPPPVVPVPVSRVGRWLQRGQ